ncbi:MAG: hypothetical protein KDD62_05590, partial [Bdellovibrionales bacterium]|nr:hypothetical protein [Bdellovibrionales bacterium]
MLPSLSAEEFLVQIKDTDGLPVIANIMGTHGVRHLPVLRTNSQGEWILNTDDINGAVPSIGFASVQQSLSFTPGVLTLNSASCPVKFVESLQRNIRLCRITAHRGEGTSQLVMWRAVGPRSQPAPGIPISIWQSERPCPLAADDEGYTLFSVRASTDNCASSLDKRQVLVGDLPGFSCTFSDTKKYLNFCPTGAEDIIYGSVVASCTVASKPNDLPTLPVTIKVTNQLGQGIQGVSLYVTPAET